MATVTSFENLRYPTKSELKQFAELFEPLFRASSEEARRQAVAALSQCDTIPPAVALFIGSQPISISAPFLTCSKALPDDILITIARSQGGAHAKAIARRADLSPIVVDALVGVRQEMPERGTPNTRPADVSVAPAAVLPPTPLPAEEAAPPASPLEATARSATQMPVQPIELSTEPAQSVNLATESTRAREAREEQLRQELRGLVRHLDPPSDDRLGLRSLTGTQEALLVRFARTRDSDHFVTTLADGLSASRALAERIMLDISGQQLATTLISVGLAEADASFILSRFYPHLGEQMGQQSRAQLMLASLDPADCDARVEAWRRADSYTFSEGQGGRRSVSGDTAAQNLRRAANRR